MGSVSSLLSAAAVLPDADRWSERTASPDYRLQGAISAEEHKAAADTEPDKRRYVVAQVAI